MFFILEGFYIFFIYCLDANNKPIENRTKTKRTYITFCIRAIQFFLSRTESAFMSLIGEKVPINDIINNI